MNNQSKCMYCGSPSYGYGCPYGPKQLHIHVDDPSKCIYCGSKSFGYGCPYGTNKLHIHGIEYNSMIKEMVSNSIVLKYLIETINKPITEFTAYKMGIINENGDIIKQPQTIEEKQSFTPVDIYLLKLKKLLGSKVDLLNGEMFLYHTARNQNDYNNSTMEESVKLYENELKIKDKINNNLKELFYIVENGYNQGISLQKIESLIVNAFCQENS